MLENGFFHADPHAGNLLALPDGKLCYLDFGMVSNFYRRTRKLLLWYLAVLYFMLLPVSFCNFGALTDFFVVMALVLTNSEW